MDFREYFNERTTMMATVVTLSALAGILFIGLLAPLVTTFTSGAKIRLDPAYFNARTILPTVLIFLAMSACMTTRYFNSKHVAAFIGALAVVEVLSYFVAPFDNVYVDLAMPVGLASLAAVSYRIARHARSNVSTRTKTRLVSPHLIHLGAVLILLGIVITSSMTIETMQGDRRAGLRFTEGATQSLGDYTVKVTGFDKYYAGESFRGQPGSQIVQEARIEVYKDGELVDRGTVKQIYDYRWQQFYTTNFITRSLGEEFFVSPANPTYVDAQGRAATLYMRVVPGMNLLWGGTILLSLGMLTIAYLDLTSESLEPRKKKRKTESKADKYEEMLQRELDARKGKKREKQQETRLSEPLTSLDMDRTTRKKLERIGITNLDGLANSDPKRLSKQTGISLEKIENWIQKAK